MFNWKYSVGEAGGRCGASTSTTTNRFNCKNTSSEFKLTFVRVRPRLVGVNFQKFHSNWNGVVLVIHKHRGKIVLADDSNLNGHANVQVLVRHCDIVNLIVVVEQIFHFGP